MDAVEIMLFCLVGFSVLVFLVLDHLDSLEKGKKVHHQIQREEAAEEEKNLFVSMATSSSVKENYFPEDDEKSVGARDDDNSNNTIVQEIVEDKEEEEPEQSPSANDVNLEERLNLLHDDDGTGEEEKEGLFDDDDWEGVERTELEKSFDEAVVFVGCKENADRIGDEQKLELYGLQRVALEGPCRGSQPMALKLSTRSKWNAWHKLGSMSQETAMEKYVDVLSKAIPGWKGEEEDTRNIQDSISIREEDLTTSTN